MTVILCYSTQYVRLGQEAPGWQPNSCSLKINILFSGGFLVDRFKGKADLLIAVSLSIAAGATVAAAWMPTISLMWFMFFTQGTCEGVINIGIST